MELVCNGVCNVPSAQEIPVSSPCPRSFVIIQAPALHSGPPGLRPREGQVVWRNVKPARSAGWRKIATRAANLIPLQQSRTEDEKIRKEELQISGLCFFLDLVGLWPNL